MMVIGNKKLPITDIIIGDRGRKKLGDIDKLSKDISENGLIVPILVTENNELIDGGRRLAAFETLGMDAIDCTVARLVESDNILQLEFSANENRKDFTRKEKLALYEKLKLPISNEKGINQYTKEDGVQNGTPSKTEPKKDRRNERAKAVGFSGQKEASQVRRIDDKGIDGLLDLVEDGSITLNVAYDIAALSEDNQHLAISCGKRYGPSKWWYYELPQTLINNMENKIISRDECEGYMIMYRDEKMSSNDISKKISHRNNQIGRAKAKNDAREEHAKIEHEAKWDIVEVRIDNISQSIKNVLEYLQYPNRNTILSAVYQAYKIHEEQTDETETHSSE